MKKSKTILCTACDDNKFTKLKICFDVSLFNNIDYYFLVKNDIRAYGKQYVTFSNKYREQIIIDLIKSIGQLKNEWDTYTLLNAQKLLTSYYSIEKQMYKIKKGRAWLVKFACYTLIK